MKFTNNRRWWSRAVERPIPSLEGRWLPLFAIGGLLAAIVFSTWHVETIDQNAAAGSPPAGNRLADFPQLPAVRVTLRADAAGHLVAIFFNGRPVRDAADLREQIKAFCGAATDAKVEAQLDCDANLRYEETQRIVREISSYPSAAGPAPLVNRVKFLPRRGKP
jgi:hypothetical protein